MSKTEIWDALAKTDPAHTKSFSRAGGFKGTAIKPIWIVRRLTEQFGPCGTGWGMGKPEFQVVQSGDEILVYCTVSCWHGDRENEFYGVGGDKVAVKRQAGTFNDDEAFKKAFTDAVGNAFKFIGIGADVHMGLFDDSKYVQQMEREFSAPTIDDATRDEIAAMASVAGVPLKKICESYSISNLKELPASAVGEVKQRINQVLEDRKEKA